MELLKTRARPGYCGVPECDTQSRRHGIHLFYIPKYVKNDPVAIKKWKDILRIEKAFPNRFLICSKHFNPKEILLPICKAANRKARLARGAFPSRSLPSGVIKPKKKSKRNAWLEELITEFDPIKSVNEAEKMIYEEEYLLDDTENDGEEWLHITKGESNEPFELSLEDATNQDASKFLSDDRVNDDDQEIFVEHTHQEGGFQSFGVQCSTKTTDKQIQVNIKPYFSLVSLWDTDKKLNTMTGIPTIAILNMLVEICQDIRPSDKCLMSMNDRICLTMFKLKTNCSFAELAIFFQTCDRTAKLYFADTIQLLCKATKGLIYWQTKEENRRSLPKCFESFPNVQTVLDCTEIKTATFNCLSCRLCTYSHYKGTHTLKFLIGVSPSGAINYISRVVAGKSSDKAIFNLTDLREKLKPGDAVMVDKGFMIGDELANLGIEMIRPELFFEKFSKGDVEKSTKIASARVHVERRISRIKQFRVLGDKICASVIPYVDDIIGVLCGLSNITPPILADERF